MCESVYDLRAWLCPGGFLWYFHYKRKNAQQLTFSNANQSGNQLFLPRRRLPLAGRFTSDIRPFMGPMDFLRCSTQNICALQHSRSMRRKIVQTIEKQFRRPPFPLAEFDSDCDVDSDSNPVDAHTHDVLPQVSLFHPSHAEGKSPECGFFFEQLLFLDRYPTNGYFFRDLAAQSCQRSASARLPLYIHTKHYRHIVPLLLVWSATK